MSSPGEDTIYERIGGESGVLELVTLFYDIMDSDSAVKQLRDLHHKDLSATRVKLFEYFSGWFGGPPLFVDKYGHPRLRARHMHVPIGITDRDEWLSCFYRALDAMKLKDDLRQDLLEKVVPMADHMRNQEDESPLADC